MKTKTGHLAIVPLWWAIASENATLLRSKALDITCVNIIVCIYIIWHTSIPKMKCFRSPVDGTLRVSQLFGDTLNIFQVLFGALDVFLLQTHLDLASSLAMTYQAIG